MKILDIVLEVLQAQKVSSEIQTAFRNRFKDDELVSKLLQKEQTELDGDGKRTLTAVIYDTDVFKDVPRIKSLIVEAVLASKERVVLQPPHPPVAPHYAPPAAAVYPMVAPRSLIAYPIADIWQNPKLEAAVNADPVTIKNIRDVFGLVTMLGIDAEKNPSLALLAGMILKGELNDEKMEAETYTRAAQTANQLFQQLISAPDADPDYFSLFEIDQSRTSTPFITSFVSIMIRKMCASSEIGMSPDWIFAVLPSAHASFAQLRLMLNRMAIVLLTKAISEPTKTTLLQKPIESFTLVVTQKVNHAQFTLVTQAHFTALLVAQQLTANRGKLDAQTFDQIVSDTLRLSVQQSNHAPSAQPLEPEQAQVPQVSAYPQLEPGSLESKLSGPPAAKAPLGAPPISALPTFMPAPMAKSVVIRELMIRDDIFQIISSAEKTPGDVEEVYRLVAQQQLVAKPIQAVFSRLIAAVLSLDAKVTEDTVEAVLTILLNQPEAVSTPYYACLEAVSTPFINAVRIIEIAITQYASTNQLPPAILTLFASAKTAKTVAIYQDAMRELLENIGLLTCFRNMRDTDIQIIQRTNLNRIMIEVGGAQIHDAKFILAVNAHLLAAIVEVPLVKSESSLKLSLLARDRVDQAKQAVAAVRWVAQQAASEPAPASVSIAFEDDEDDTALLLAEWQQEITAAEASGNTTSLLSKIAKIETLPIEAVVWLYDRLAPSKDLNELTHKQLKVVMVQEEIFLAFIINPKLHKLFAAHSNIELPKLALKNRSALKRSSLLFAMRQELLHISAAEDAKSEAVAGGPAVRSPERPRSSIPAPVAPREVPATPPVQVPSAEFFTDAAELALAEYKDGAAEEKAIYLFCGELEIFNTLVQSGMTLTKAELNQALKMFTNPEMKITHPMATKAALRPLQLAISNDPKSLLAELLNSQKPKDWHKCFVEIVDMVVGVFAFSDSRKHREVINDVATLKKTLEQDTPLDRAEFCRVMEKVIVAMGSEGCLKNITPIAQVELQSLRSRGVINWSQLAICTRFKTIPANLVLAHVMALAHKIESGLALLQPQVYGQGAPVASMFAVAGSPPHSSSVVGVAQASSTQPTNSSFQ